jgi:hypothetical protein
VKETNIYWDGSHKMWYLVIKGQPRWEPGDEIDCLGDSWLFLVWSSDSSPYLTNSMASRLPICMIPASRYAVSETGVNLTVQAAAEQIKNSFNTMSRTGVKIRDVTSVRARAASRSVCLFLYVYIYTHLHMYIYVCVYIYIGSR